MENYHTKQGGTDIGSYAVDGDLIKLVLPDGVNEFPATEAVFREDMDGVYRLFSLKKPISPSRGIVIRVNRWKVWVD